jgi:Lar family restriction alleviation protein
MGSSKATPELLACPFCGSADVELRDGDAFEVACNNCGARTGKAWSLIDGRKRAIAAWNTRHPSEAPAMEAALREWCTLVEQMEFTASEVASDAIMAEYRKARAILARIDGGEK